MQPGLNSANLVGFTFASPTWTFPGKNPDQPPWWTLGVYTALFSRWRRLPDRCRRRRTGWSAGGPVRRSAPSRNTASTPSPRAASSNSSTGPRKAQTRPHRRQRTAPTTRAHPEQCSRTKQQKHDNALSCLLAWTGASFRHAQDCKEHTKAGRLRKITWREIWREVKMSCLRFLISPGVSARSVLCFLCNHNRQRHSIQFSLSRFPLSGNFLIQKVVLLWA